MEEVRENHRDEPSTQLATRKKKNKHDGKGFASIKGTWDTS